MVKTRDDLFFSTGGGVSSQLSLPLFIGRDREFQKIEFWIKNSESNWQNINNQLILVNGPGGIGKTAFALEVSRRFKTHFTDGILPLMKVADHTPLSFALNLAKILKIEVEEPKDEVGAQHLITSLLKERCYYLILDDLLDFKNLKYMIPTQTRSFIVVTTRNRDMGNLLRLMMDGAKVREIGLSFFSKKETLALFQVMLGKNYKAEEEQIFLDIAENLGFLPIALRKAIATMVISPHYSSPALLEKLESKDRLNLLRKADKIEDSSSQTIESIFDLSSPLLTGPVIEVLQYMAVCSPGPIPIDFLEHFSTDHEIGERLEYLYSISWCERREQKKGEKRYRFYELHPLVRELVKLKYGNQYRDLFIDLVHSIFLEMKIHYDMKSLYFPQLNEAFLLLVECKDSRLKEWLYGLYDICVYSNHLDFYMQLSEHVHALFPEDSWVLRAVYGNQALILAEKGELKEAFEFLKKQETICEELGDQAGLARSYGNQALILGALERMEDALALHKKQEHISEALGDLAGLAQSFGNQALILGTWGRLQEALALYKKQEHINEELEDLVRLAENYGNQALILGGLGRIEDSLILYKKQEFICEQLGDLAGLAQSYGNQALILRALDRLQDALALYKKEGDLYEQLGDSCGFAQSLWNQGLIFKEKNEPETQIKLWEKSILLNKKAKVPTKDFEEKLCQAIHSKRKNHKGIKKQV
jgi:tetratricopeptide (TPR) repeat protein